MIEAYLGRPGSGKTYSMVSKALKLVGHVPIYANMSVDWAERFTGWEQLIGLSNGLILLDEAGIWFNSRNYRNMPDEVSSFLAQSRKRGLDLWYTVQNIENVDAHFRRLTATQWLHQRYGPLIIATGTDPQSGEKFQTRYTMINSEVYKRYDTFEVVGAREGNMAAVRGPGADKRIEMTYIKILNKGWCRDVDCEFGSVSWRRAEPADIWIGNEIYEFEGGRPVLMAQDYDELTEWGQRSGKCLLTLDRASVRVS